VVTASCLLLLSCALDHRGFRFASFGIGGGGSSGNSGIFVSASNNVAGNSNDDTQQQQQQLPRDDDHAEDGSDGTPEEQQQPAALGGNIKTRNTNHKNAAALAAGQQHHRRSERTSTSTGAGGGGGGTRENGGEVGEDAPLDADADADAEEITTIPSRPPTTEQQAEGADGNNNVEAERIMDAVKVGPPEEQHKVIKTTKQKKKKKEQKRGDDNGNAETTAHQTQWDRESAETYTDMSHLNLGQLSAKDAAHAVMETIMDSTKQRMTKLYEKAESDECRRKIGEHMGYFINAIGVEGSMPFHEEQFYSECEEEKYDFAYLPKGVSIGDIQNRTYRPPKNETEYLVDSADLKLLYAILTHTDPQSTIRLIEALYQDGYTFVIHVDGKESSDDTYDALVEYATTRDYVHVLPHPFRIRANWGGFSLVNATLQILRYSFAHDNYPNDKPLDFHKFVHIASTTYPIKSNAEIRRTIAQYPIDANFVHVVFKPADPSPSAWNYFVECDDALHRIYRLTPLDDLNWGVDIYTSSQWFALSREFADYIADAAPGTIVHDLLEYAEHVVVADESFFGTVLRHSKFCGKHHNNNFLHVHFDRWENELDDGSRDSRKCVMKDPDHCGRSPTTMTMDYLPVLELVGDLFARKFIDSVDTNIKDVIDIKRAREEKYIVENAENSFDIKLPPNPVDTTFEGEGVLIVAKETLSEEEPLCLGLGETKNKVRLFPCFREGVASTLAPQWETGAVIIEETLPHNRWDIGPCSSDGNIDRMDSGELNVTQGLHSRTGPSCLLKQVDGLRKGRCTDIETERLKPGGPVHVFPCVHRWNQFVSFGDGEVTPKGSIHSNVPLHIIDRIKSKGRTQHPYMCFAASGRGEDDTDDWEEDAKLDKADKSDDESLTPDIENFEALKAEHGKPPLKLWSGKQLVSTPCSNTDAVIEWLFVPYIVEDSLDVVEGEGEEEL